MLIRIGYDIVYQIPDRTAVTVLLQVMEDRLADLKHPDPVLLDPPLPMDEFKDCFGNRCVRFVAPAGRLRVHGDTVIEDSGLPCPADFDAVQHEIQDLPPDTLEFLLPSRYCEVDRLTEIAWQIFGQLPKGWSLVQAINDWVYNNIQFGYQFASATKTAYDVYQDRKGVCRDFTHLAITFCRAMNIPTRYATGYLGDIGVPFDGAVMDYSACYQVYLGNKWHIFDSRHNIRRIGWVLLAVGRDAADCALTTSFGPHILEKFTVFADEVQTAELTPRIAATVQPK
jgi:transglutaminase-like putative cysteine protease